MLSRFFSEQCETIEREYVSSAEVNNVMTELRKKIMNTMKDKFYGKSTVDALKLLNTERKQKFEVEVRKFVERCTVYLDEWYDANKSEFKDLAFLSLRNSVHWDDVKNFQVNLVEKYILSSCMMIFVYFVISRRA